MSNYERAQREQRQREETGEAIGNTVWFLTVFPWRLYKRYRRRQQEQAAREATRSNHPPTAHRF